MPNELDMEATSDPYVFVNKEKQLYLIAHADDLRATVPELEMNKLFDEIVKHILLTMQPLLVP